MALKLNLQTEPTGLSFPEAYCKIISVEHARNMQNASISCYFYKDEQARIDGKEPINTSFPSRFVISGDVYSTYFPNTNELIPNEIVRSYEALKSIPLFAEAIDC